MSTLQVGEFERGEIASVGVTPVLHGPPHAIQTLTPTGASQNFAQLNLRTRFVRFHARVACAVRIGAVAGDATTGDLHLAANQTEVIGVDPGSYVSVIAI